MPIQAINNFIFIVLDDAESEKDGLLLPGQSHEKPHFGKAFSVGALVQDKKIKSGKKIMFHKGNGFTIEYDGIEYLVIEGHKIIAVL